MAKTAKTDADTVEGAAVAAPSAIGAPKKKNASLERAKEKSKVVKMDPVYDGNRLSYVGVSFAGQDLSKKNDEGTPFQNFKSSICRDADFSGANLEGQNFQGADLRGANLSGANCRNADFRWANMEGVITDDDSDFEDALVNETHGI